MTPELVFEHDEVAGLALHAGVVFWLEADPSLPPKPMFEELFDPTPRWWLLARELASGRTRRVVPHPLPRPERLFADAAGVALVSMKQTHLVDPESGEARVVPVGAPVERVLGHSSSSVFVAEQTSDAVTVDAVRRERGTVERGVFRIEGEPTVLATDGTLAAWAPSHSREVHVSRLDAPAEARVVELDSHIH